MCSSSSLAAMDIYQENHYTMVSPSSTAIVLSTRGNVAFNRVCWSDKIQGPAAATFVYEQLGLTKIATIHDGSPYGEGLVGAMADAFKVLGGEIVAQEAVNVGDTDMRPLLERIKAAGPQLIYFGGFVAEGAFLAAQRVDVGMNDVVFMGADGIQATDFVTSAGDAAEGVYASAANPAEAGAGLPDFLKAYQDKYGGEPPAPFHAHAYDATMVVMNAIAQVGKTDAQGNLHIGRKALSDAIRGTSDYKGLSGTITCDANGDCGTGGVAVSQVQSGAFAVIWPK
jgi:branched-chain amino acid transport system substrate-binding protein